jgi:hypothetical protein
LLDLFADIGPGYAAIVVDYDDTDIIDDLGDGAIADLTSIW